MSDSFKIEQTSINLSFDWLDKDQWEIQSVPYSYSVTFCDETKIKEVVASVKKQNKEKSFIYIDETVAGLYGESLFQGIEKSGIAALEENKSLPYVTGLLDTLQEKNITKNEALLSAGGGITQDLSAFARSVYKRGINWVYLPTTLLSMADSCIGAKSCLNYGGAKNQLGLFSAPREVYIADVFLQTLSHQDILSGYGEIIKLCIVGGRQTIDRFAAVAGKQEGNLLTGIAELLKLSLLVKKAVIEIDEYENNIRRALNYGHTVGHAIEPLVDYKIPHGIAVSIGMIAENLIAVHAGILCQDQADELNKLIYPFIDQASMAMLRGLNTDDLLKNMKKDKKNVDADIQMSVPYAIGYFDMLRIKPDQAFRAFFDDLLKKTI
jgi:3-dehydroquinate synthase